MSINCWLMAVSWKKVDFYPQTATWFSPWQGLHRSSIHGSLQANGASHVKRIHRLSRGHTSCPLHEQTPWWLWATHVKLAEHFVSQQGSPQNGGSNDVKQASSLVQSSSPLHGGIEVQLAWWFSTVHFSHLSFIIHGSWHVLGPSRVAEVSFEMHARFGGQSASTLHGAGTHLPPPLTSSTQTYPATHLIAAHVVVVVVLALVPSASVESWAVAHPVSKA